LCHHPVRQCRFRCSECCGWISCPQSTAAELLRPSSTRDRKRSLIGASRNSQSLRNLGAVLPLGRSSLPRACGETS
jgi:hypothetical protein